MLFPQYKQKATPEYWTSHFGAHSLRELVELPRAAVIMNFLEKHLKKDAKILEAGASNGRFLILFKKKGFKNVEGFDINDELIAQAAKEGVIVKKGDILNPPFSDGAYDLYLDIGTLEHFHPREQDRILQECRRVLKSKGLLALDVTYFTRKRLLLFPIMVVKNWLRRLKGATFYQYIFTVGEVKKLLRRNGFEIVDSVDRDPRILVLARKV